MLKLRRYQENVKAAVYHALRTRDDNPCAVVPTAGGKTHIIGSICQDAVGLWGERVMVLAHVKELLEQNADKLKQICPEVGTGIYSAGLARRDTNQPVIVAGIQSVYERACEFDAFNLIIVDEAHLIPLEGDGMYRRFLSDAQAANPKLRIIGFTATPFRLKTGPICAPDAILNHICCEISVRELMRDEYLCPPVTRVSETVADTTNLHIGGGEFVPSDVERLMNRDELVRAACSEILAHTADRRSTLIFASSVEHARHVVDTLKTDGVACGFVCGTTPSAERAETIRRFRDGELRYVCNVNVLTTGFDVPRIDCVALLRPTLSPGLYYQMVGRGFRPHPNKQDCLVLDFGGNVLRHGPVDKIQVRTQGSANGEAPSKECPACGAVIAAGFARCPNCSHAFAPPERIQHDAKASDEPILSWTNYAVKSVFYSVHTKSGAPRSLRVKYRVGLNEYKFEWICLEHKGWPRLKAIEWWRRRSANPVPETVERALKIIKSGGLAPTLSITVRPTDGFEQVIDCELGPLPGRLALTEGEPQEVLS